MKEETQAVAKAGLCSSILWSIGGVGSSDARFEGSLSENWLVSIVGGGNVGAREARTEIHS